MTIILDYLGENKPKTENYKSVLGIDFSITLTHELGAAAAVKEAYFMLENSSGVIVVSLNKADHSAQFDFTTSDECTIKLLDTNTNGLTAGNYNWGFVLVDQSDIKAQPWYGSWELVDGYVIVKTSAPHETWTTGSARDTSITNLETFISNYGNSFDVNYLSASASASAATITLQDASVVGGGAIRIMLNSGAYDDNTASSTGTGTAANVITLANPLAGAASKYKAVRKGP